MHSMVIVPTYNERENIEAIVRAVLELPVDLHVTIVDDDSPDGTGRIAAEMARRDERLHVIHREGKLGLGTAYIEGFRYALAQGAKLILQMDADFSHDPGVIPSLLQAAKDSDVVVGSRYVSGGGTRNWGLLRRLTSRGGSLYARTILNIAIRDLTGGFNCWRREVLETLRLDDVSSVGFGFMIEMKYRAVRQGFRLTEIPIIFVDRRVGQSKMSGGIAGEALLKVWELRFDRSIGKGLRRAQGTLKGAA